MYSSNSVLTYLCLVLVLVLPISGLAGNPEQDLTSDTSTQINARAGQDKTPDEIAHEITNPLAPLTYLNWHNEYRS